MKATIGRSTYNFATFATMAVDQQRILDALAAGHEKHLSGTELHVEVAFREVDQYPVVECVWPERSVTPEELDQAARTDLTELLSAARLNPTLLRDHGRRLAELLQTYEDVRFRKVSALAAGAFRPGSISVFLTPELAGEALTAHIILTLARETYHAAAAKLTDRRRVALRQHLTYSDERGFQTVQEILACLFQREVARLAGCPWELNAGPDAGFGYSRECVRLGERLLTRLGLDFSSLSACWLLTQPAADTFFAAQGDALFRGLHAPD